MNINALSNTRFGQLVVSTKPPRRRLLWGLLRLRDKNAVKVASLQTLTGTRSVYATGRDATKAKQQGGINILDIAKALSLFSQ